MNYTEQILVVSVIGLIGLTAVNFGGDWVFRGAQIEINSNFILMHNNTIMMTDALGSVVLDLNEKMNIVLDELFDRIWEDLESS